MKRLLAVVCAAAVASLAGCGYFTPEKAAAPEAGATAVPASQSGLMIRVITKANGDVSPYWRQARSGALAAGDALGVTVEVAGPDDETQVEQQVEQLRQAVDAGSDGIALAPLDSEAAQPVLQSLQDAGIPLVSFDTAITGEVQPLTHIATDNFQAGREAAREMAKLMNGQVAIVAHSQIASSSVERRDGFLNYLEENETGLSVVNVVYADSLEASALDQATELLSENPALKGIFATDDDGAVGAGKAVDAANRTGKVTVVGFDSGTAQMQMIREGKIAGSVTQNPYIMGYMAVETLVKAINGETPSESFMNSGHFWYNAKNIDNPEIAAALYED